MPSRPLSDIFLQPRIRVFLVLAETRNFSAAAARLGLSQSSVSRNLSELEEQLAVTLVDREVRPARLTPAGHALETLLRRGFAGLEDSVSRLREQNALLPPLRLGIVESVASNLSTGIVGDLRGSCSSVTVLTGISAYLLKQLDADKLDIIICPEPFLNRNDLSRRALFEEPSVIVAPAGADLPPEPSWEQLRFCGLPLIRYSSENSGRRLQEQYFRKLGLHFVARVEADINALLLGFVAEGLGWALTRSTTLAQHPELAAQLRVFPVPPPVASRRVYVISRSDRSGQLPEKVAHSAVRAFREKVVPKFISRAPWTRPMLRIAGADGVLRPLFPQEGGDVPETAVY